jgi:hypothetical protein
MWIIAGLIVGCAVWFAWMAEHARMGYEDENGFHEGER